MNVPANANEAYAGQAEIVCAVSRTSQACGINTDLPLSPAEREEMAAWRNPKRSFAWRCGRLLAKRLLAKYVARYRDLLGLEQDGKGDPTLQHPEILSQPRPGVRGRPVVRLGGRELDCCLSISHVDGFIGVALALEVNRRVGIDLARIEPVTQGFVSTWFTPRERRALSVASRETVWRYWTAKEAAYKASNRGERFAPQQIEVVERAGGATCVCCYASTTRRCRAVWQCNAELVVAVAVEEEAGQSGKPSLLHWESIDD